ncbi:MAG: CDP-glycerol glycerophosphotransferase family protein [Candidatus Marinimicrobia bacterium]|nr:CDP-glycerol glycerophosphotransferase family protein [Candidatus Neomarinimicrobiota bacterium]MBL7009634.1 CDP-glycerol glycerophosphotransferase family protein [Candidatus Neomarinimicrobiota bacterium]MBL7029623.1 CDP-glycerol glycerophosphotransferase family protein [Candidatus Neomarinimicrobiota bacterium]
MTKVLFENHHLYYLPNFIPIIEEMRRRGEYEIVASIPSIMHEKEKDIFHSACRKLNIDIVSELDEESRIRLLREEAFDVVVVGNVGQLNPIVHDYSLAVMVYHGIGLKQSYYNDIDERIDLRSVESEPRLIELESHGHKNLVLTGFTKCDPLASSIGSKEVELENIGLNRDRKTVLYAPSFYPSSLDELAPILGKVSFEINIIIKLHNFSWYQDRYIYQSQVMQNLVNEFPNIYLAPPEDYNIIPYYSLADLLVSDISSTMFEFLYLNRPIIMAECVTLRLKHRIFKKRFLKKMDMERMEDVDFGFRFENPEDLPALVYHALEYPLDLESERLRAQKDFLYKVDGLSSVRLVDAIETKLAGKSN